MFRGVNALTLDSKGRLAVPSRYRDQLAEQCGGRLVVTVDPDHCLLLYPLPAWEEIERKLVKLPSFNAQARRLQRLLVGHATECELDAAGRILLPTLLREFAQMDKDVVLIGQGNKFEIWSAAAWDAGRSEWLAAGTSGDLPAELGSLSL